MPKTFLSNINNIGEMVRQMESNYISGMTTISKFVQRSMYDDLCQIDAYLNSKHISGDTDSLGREKPFFNIVTAARNIWFRATDIDRKNIRLKAVKARDYLTSFLATVHLQDYMRRENFGQFLNDWGLQLASYGSAVSKFIEKDSRLYTQVIPWSRIICDPIDFDSNPVIEILELTEAQLRQREGYDQEIVENLCNTITARETIDKTKKDQRSNYIKLYEVHGNLPLAYLTGEDEDFDEYVPQMHVISFVAGKNGRGWDDFTLISGREKQSPYQKDDLIKQDGQTLAIGSVQNLFEAQWMVNHNIKAIKDQLDLASKMVFQIADPSFAGRNVLSSLIDGQIVVYDNQKDPNGLRQVPNNSHDITSLQSFGQQWQLLSQEINSTPDVMMGKNMPSGTAFRQAAIIQQESHSNFEIMTENKGLAIEQMMRKYIIPYLKKKMDTADEVSATLEDYDITKIDAIYIPNEAVRRFNQKAVEAVINDEELPDLQQEMQGVRADLGVLGNQRFFKPSDISDKTWKEIFKDYEWEPEVEITDETIDKEPILTTLSNVLQTIATNPMILQDPNAKMLFNKILETTGSISPLQLSVPQSQPQQQMQPANQMGGQMVGAGNNIK
jgi:hypothetical protein